MTRSHWYQTLLVLGTTAWLALSGIGAECPGKSKSGSTFENLLLAPSSTPVKRWGSPIFFDLALIGTSFTVDYSSSQSTSVDYNRGLGTRRYPTTLFMDARGSLFAVFTAGSNATPSKVYVYGTQPDSFAPSAWASAFSSYAWLDLYDVDSTYRYEDGGSNSILDKASIDSGAAVAVVDSRGTATVVFPMKNEDGQYHPAAVRHLQGGGGGWSMFTDLLAGSTGDTTNAVLPDTLAAAASGENVVVVWCQGTSAYYNHYRPATGWRFVGSTSASTWTGSACSTVQNSTGGDGADFAFDDEGNGFGVYALNPSGSYIQVKARLWRNNAFGTSDITVSGATDKFFLPRVFIDSESRAHVFMYRNNGGAYELWHSQATVNASSPSFSSPTQFDAGSGEGNVYVGAGSQEIESFKPLLVYKGDKAAVFFIKSDGTAERLWYSTYAVTTGTWSTPAVVDALGDSGSEIFWAHAAINENGELAVVYTFGPDLDQKDHVYGNVRYQGKWSGATWLDTLSTITNSSSPPGTLSRFKPSVVIDANGNGAAAFSAVVSGRRRAFAVFFQ